jgi:hypothetical protein
VYAAGSSTQEQCLLIGCTCSYLPQPRMPRSLATLPRHNLSPSLLEVVNHDAKLDWGCHSSCLYRARMWVSCFVRRRFLLSLLSLQRRLGGELQFPTAELGASFPVGLLLAVVSKTQNVLSIQSSSLSTLHQPTTTIGLTAVTHFHFSCF